MPFWLPGKFSPAFLQDLETAKTTGFFDIAAHGDL